MSSAIRSAIIRVFDPVTYTATVQIVGSLPSYLAGVPVAHHLRANLLVPGAKCGVIFFDEANPTDAAVTLLFGGTPATADYDVDGNLNVDGLVTVAGTVDGVDVSAHTHGGAGQGGTVGHASLSGVSADQHHAQSHAHASHTGIGANDHHNQAHALSGADHTGSLSHTTLGDIGANTHPTIDTHLAANASTHGVNVTALKSSGGTFVIDLPYGSAAYLLSASFLKGGGSTHRSYIYVVNSSHLNEPATPAVVTQIGAGSGTGGGSISVSISNSTITLTFNNINTDSACGYTLVQISGARL